jgi:hypothetical protein
MSKRMGMLGTCAGLTIVSITRPFSTTRTSPGRQIAVYTFHLVERCPLTPLRMTMFWLGDP